MFEQLIANADPASVILIVVLIIYVGKEVYVKKSDQSKLEKDINCQSSKFDNSLSLTRQEFTGAINNLKLQNKDEFSAHSDKFYEKIDSVLDKVDAKYVSKEINKIQEDRLKRQEESLSEIRKDLAEIRGEVSDMKPYLEKIDVLVEMVTEFIGRK